MTTDDTRTDMQKASRVDLSKEARIVQRWLSRLRRTKFSGQHSADIDDEILSALKHLGRLQDQIREIDARMEGSGR